LPKTGIVLLPKRVDAMATMNVSLPTEMLEFVEKEVSAGGYTSSSEVVRDALRLLQHDKALEQEKLAILRREVDLGLDAAAAGRFSGKTVQEIADEVRREHSAG
jgi:antitoxin ParD1/3/4